jgi:hypothetical protein
MTLKLASAATDAERNARKQLQTAISAHSPRQRTKLMEKSI